MVANNRIFYACQAVGIAKYKNGIQEPGNTPVALFTPLHGVQSVGISTSFNLEQAFELGMLEIYDNIEGVPEVEVTIERLLDGYPLAYQLATTGAMDTTKFPSFSERAAAQCNVLLGIWNDTVDNVGGLNADKPPITQVLMSGMYVSSLTYTFPVDGNFTESITLVGNSKGYFGQPEVLFPGSPPQQLIASNVPNGFGINIANEFRKLQNGLPPITDSPKASGGLQTRDDIMMGKCILPFSLPMVAYNGGIGTAGNNSYIVQGRVLPRAHIQNITISFDLGREDIFELGRKLPYVKTATFPVEITTEIEVIATESDRVNADPNKDRNTVDETIKIVLLDGTAFDLGNKNRLTSVNYTGGDAGGGNATITYSYLTYNYFMITDPSVLVRWIQI